MKACEWKAKIIAIGRASAAGDDAPLDILCDQLASMSERCEAKSLPTTLHDYEPATKQKTKAALPLFETERSVAVEIPIIEKSKGRFDVAASDGHVSDARKPHSEG